jgi:hypothetical protein
MESTGAEDEARTRDLNLGKVALYQLSYFRMYWQDISSTTIILPNKRTLRDCKIKDCANPAKFFLQCYLY